MTAFVGNISAAIDRDAATLPPRIRDICFTEFLTTGWNSKKKAVTNAAIFTSENLLDALKRIHAEVDNWEPPVVPTAEELSDLALACNKLWELDHHRLVPGHDYVLDLQRGKGFYDDGDVASQPLFSFVDEKVFLRPTFAAFVSLFDNYSASIGKGLLLGIIELNSFYLFFESNS